MIGLSQDFEWRKLQLHSHFAILATKCGQTNFVVNKFAGHWNNFPLRIFS